MWIATRRFMLSLILLGSWLLCRAQTPIPALQEYLSQSIAEANGDQSVTIADWKKRHPGEVLEEPMDKGDPRTLYTLDPREQRDVKLEGRWCMKSIATIDLASGIHIRRIALFYPPLVEHIYDKPLPALPSETGEDLRNHGCRLVKILHEFVGVPDPGKFGNTVASQISEKRSEEPGHLLEPPRDDYWSPVWSAEKFGQPLSQYFFFYRNPKIARPGDHPDFLLQWQWGTSDYGQPSDKTINPEAGQPWLALRAARLADLPEQPTLDMLSFLAPQVGDTWEQAPLYCEKQLIPVLRKWLDLATLAKPEQHAAAVLLADQVLDRLDFCREFANGGYSYLDDQKIQAEDKNALEKHLQELGVETETTARLGFTSYTGNFRNEVLKLAPQGPVNELGRMAILDGSCQWSYNSDSADCANIIQQGENFLTHFPDDEWTSTVHLILAEAYALTASNPEEESSPTPQMPREELERKAAEHYRAWYARSKNERDRALIWQEIWAIEAGMGPSLMVPAEVRR